MSNGDDGEVIQNSAVVGLYGQVGIEIGLGFGFLRLAPLLASWWIR